MIILIMFTTVLFKLVKDIKINFIDFIIRNLLGQSSMEINIFSSMQMKNISMITLIIIWLQSASILSKAFSGLLLNTYFNVKSVSIVNSLEDIINNQDINIGLDIHLFNHAIQESNLIDQDTKNGIIKRVKKY